MVDVGKYAWEASAWFWAVGNPDGKNLNKYVEVDNWSTVSEAINPNEKGKKGERNKYINEFYEIKTGESLGLPEDI